MDVMMEMKSRDEDMTDEDMTTEEAADILRNAAWLGTYADRKQIEEAVEMAINALTAQPEIIRCKKCRYKKRKGVDYFCDHITGEEIMVSPNDYCSWAEREMDG